MGVALLVVVGAAAVVAALVRAVGRRLGDDDGHDRR